MPGKFQATVKKLWPERFTRTETEAEAAKDFGVYIHVPYCRVRCGYCDFNTYTANELKGTSQKTFPQEVIQELSAGKDLLVSAGVPERNVSTVFFGGGTPTLLPASDLAEILKAIKNIWGLKENAEVTVEANPDTVNYEYMSSLKKAGFTRVSVGMQSAVPHVLEALDRTHNPENVATAVAAAKKAGLDVSVDLIYGAPGESLDDWEKSLQTALALDPDHISTYALIIEDGTKLARQIRRGEVEAPSDDLQAAMYEKADELITSAGYSWYELSNWAKSESQISRHNRAYWMNSDWWGAGPGAHSHVAGVRWWNVKHPAAYALKIATEKLPVMDFEIPTKEQTFLEIVLLRSRLAEGIPLRIFSDLPRETVSGLIARGLIEGKSAISGTLVLTLKGRLLADAVVHELTENVH